MGGVVPGCDRIRPWNPSACVQVHLSKFIIVPLQKIVAFATCRGTMNCASTKIFYALRTCTTSGALRVRHTQMHYKARSTRQSVSLRALFNPLIHIERNKKEVCNICYRPLPKVILNIGRQIMRCMLSCNMKYYSGTPKPRSTISIAIIVMMGMKMKRSVLFERRVRTFAPMNAPIKTPSATGAATSGSTSPRAK